MPITISELTISELIGMLPGNFEGFQKALAPYQDSLPSLLIKKSSDSTLIKLLTDKLYNDPIIEHKEAYFDAITLIVQLVLKQQLRNIKDEFALGSALLAIAALATQPH